VFEIPVVNGLLRGVHGVSLLRSVVSDATSTCPFYFTLAIIGVESVN
jgi:hypothetical protein